MLKNIEDNKFLNKLNYVPYGYKCVNGNIVEDKIEAEVVRKIFSLYSSDVFNLRDIVIELKNDDLKTRMGNNWKYMQISRILHNPVYCGYIRFNGVIYKGNHKGLIEEYLFLRCQEIIANRRNGVPFRFEDYERK